MCEIVLIFVRSYCVSTTSTKLNTFEQNVLVLWTQLNKISRCCEHNWTKYLGVVKQLNIFFQCCEDGWTKLGHYPLSRIVAIHYALWPTDCSALSVAVQICRNRTKYRMIPSLVPPTALALTSFSCPIGCSAVPGGGGKSFFPKFSQNKAWLLF